MYILCIIHKRILPSAHAVCLENYHITRRKKPHNKSGYIRILSCRIHSMTP